MAATHTQPIAKEAYLMAVDELVSRLGKKAAAHFMRQALTAVEQRPTPVRSAHTRDLYTRQRSKVFGDALVEASRP